jgi:hypothetical protein
MKISLHIVGITILLIVFIVFIFLFSKKYKQKNQDQKYIDDNVEMFMQEIQKISDIIENYSNTWADLAGGSTGKCITFNNYNAYTVEVDLLKNRIGTLLTQVNNTFPAPNYNTPRGEITDLIGVDNTTDPTAATGLYAKINTFKGVIENIPASKLCSTKCDGTGQKYVITIDTDGKYTGKCVCDNGKGFIYATNTDGTSYCKDWKTQFSDNVSALSNDISSIGTNGVQSNPTLSSTVIASSDSGARVVV